MDAIEDITTVIDRLDKQRVCLEEVKMYIVELEQYQCDDNLDDFLTDGIVYRAVEECIVNCLKKHEDILQPFARSVLQFVERLDYCTNKLIDPPIRIVLISAMLKTVKVTKQYEDQLKRRDYTTFFEELASDVCATKNSAKRTRTNQK